MFGFLSPKTFGNHSLKLLSKRCAQCSAAESEEVGENPDHSPEGSRAVLAGAAFSAALLYPWGTQLSTEDVQGHVQASSPQASSQKVRTKHVQDCPFLHSAGCAWLCGGAN